MITLFEQYTIINDVILPQKGDWVIDVSGEYGEVVDVLKLKLNNVDGEWISSDVRSTVDNIALYQTLFVIKYDTRYNTKSTYKAWRSEIDFIGSKEEVDVKIKAKKYNL